jgi:hypothetical protein
MKLLHYSAAPFQFDPSRVYQGRSERDHKPMGLWLSVEGDYDWPAWCEGESFNLESLKYVSEVTLKPDATVLLLDTVDRLDAFTHRFGVPDVHELRSIAWNEVKERYDGIIIAPYHGARRLSLMWYYTWDCASAVIWNLSAIAEVKCVQPSTDAK